MFFMSKAFCMDVFFIAFVTRVRENHQHHEFNSRPICFSAELNLFIYLTGTA
uniref:Uncharacterized protein n=1 Tax=Anguilla anguilla TaxID=7936 RepID=A0A0E9W607_ANGAN